MKFFCFLIIAIIFTSLSFTYTFLFISKIIYFQNYSFNNLFIQYIISTKPLLIKITIFSFCNFVSLLYLIGFGRSHTKDLILTTRIFYKSCIFLSFTTFLSIAAIVGIFEINNHLYSL